MVTLTEKAVRELQKQFADQARKLAMCRRQRDAVVARNQRLSQELVRVRREAS